MDSARPCCLDWRFCKIIGLAIGWLGVLANCGLIYGLCQHTGKFDGSIHETIIAFLPGKQTAAGFSWPFQPVEHLPSNIIQCNA